MLEVYIDGACEPVNPGGTASYGVVVLKALDEKKQIPTDWNPDVVWTDYGIVGSGPKMSNNVSEYCALLKFLEWLDIRPVEDVTIYSDSRLVVNQMAGNWIIRKGLYKPYAEDCLNWLIQNADMWSSRIKFEWIPREENIADELTVKALNEVGIKRRY